MTTFVKEIIQPLQHAIQHFGARNAFCIDGAFYTYREFGNRIAEIQEALHRQPTSCQSVGLVTNDDLETYAAIYALWLEGLSYVPLHPHWPLDRCQDILEQVGIELILDSSEESRYKQQTILPTRQLPLAEQSEFHYRTDVPEEHIAYILFTSGTTGKPKGVQITRGNVAAFMENFWHSGITVDETDRCLQAFDLTFDFSNWSYLVPLAKGACCYTIPDGKIKYLYASELIEDYGITFAPLAPSMLRYLRPYFQELDATSLKCCIFSAEACPMDLMEDLFKIAPEAELWNWHGATETTISDTCYRISREGGNKTLNGMVTMGKALHSLTCEIFDEELHRLPRGEKGELCIAGPQITPGYLNDEEKNAKSFFICEINGKPMRFYRTGDLCMADAEGDLMYCGRIDHQAKIQGFRVEMGEIEHHAQHFLQGIQVVCLPFQNQKSLTEIAMFIESKEFDLAELNNYMRSKMPAYMIPTRTLFVPKFGLTSNGKIDKKELMNLLNNK